MNNKLLNGKWLAKYVHSRIRDQVAAAQAKYGRVPGLGVILVGDNPASQAYVANKEKVATKRCGFATFDVKLGADAAFEDVRAAIDAYNAAEEIDGVLLQLPLPEQLEANRLLDLIDPAKDVDGLHPLNQGLLQRGEGQLRPCTPSGIMLLLDLAFADVDTAAADVPEGEIAQADLSGKTAVVIGRSLLVGKPVAALLLERNATVIQTHSRTADLPAVVRQADIVVAAVGRPQMVKGSWLKPDAVVIDVGINRQADGKLVGDVDFNDALPSCGAITPVPGGVGPMTVAMLMHNTLQAFLARQRQG